jgi:hypothetical protein
MNRDLLDFMAPPMAPMPQGLGGTSINSPRTDAAPPPRPPNAGQARRGGLRKEYDVTEGETVRRIVVTTAREIWALDELVLAGETGCTLIDNPGPRWSGYVYKLKRNHGLSIETRTEAHGGPFKGHHARYVLRSTVRAAGSEAA